MTTNAPRDDAQEEAAASQPGLFPIAPEIDERELEEPAGKETPMGEAEMGRIVLLVISLFFFAVTVLIGFGIAVWASAAAWDRAKELITLVIPVETLIIGGAVAFYFKSEDR